MADLASKPERVRAAALPQEVGTARLTFPAERSADPVSGIFEKLPGFLDTGGQRIVECVQIGNRQRRHHTPVESAYRVTDVGHSGGDGARMTFEPALPDFVQNGFHLHARHVSWPRNR